MKHDADKAGSKEILEDGHPKPVTLDIARLEHKRILLLGWRQSRHGRTWCGWRTYPATAKGVRA